MAVCSPGKRERDLHICRLTGVISASPAALRLQLLKAVYYRHTKTSQVFRLQTVNDSRSLALGDPVYRMMSPSVFTAEWTFPGPERAQLTSSLSL